MDKQTYVINYNDNSHMALELAPEMSSLLLSEMVKDSAVAYLPGIGTLRLTDVRSIILQHPTEELKEQPSYAPERTAEEEEWLRQEEWIRKHYASLENEAKDDADYDGGMMPR